MKKVLYLFLMSFLLVFLVACTNEKDLTAEWHDRAEDTGFDLQSSDGYGLFFFAEGMKGMGKYNPTSFDDKDRPPAFPFELETYYPNYELTQKDETITIKTTDDLEYTLNIRGARLFRDEKNKLDYTTSFYLLGEEESQE